MDGQRTFRDIAVTLFMEKGLLAPELVSQTAGRLMQGGFTTYRWTKLYQQLLRRFKGTPRPPRLRHAIARVLKSELVLTRVDAPLALIYRGGGRLLFGRTANVMLTVLLVAGLAAFAAALTGGHRPRGSRAAAGPDRAAASVVVQRHGPGP